MQKLSFLVLYLFLSFNAGAQPKVRFSSEALSVTANGYFAAVSTKDSFFVYRLPELQLYKKMKHSLLYPSILGFAASAFDKPDLNDVLIVQENNLKPTNPALGINLWAQLERYQKSAFGERVRDSVGLWSISKAAFINNRVPGNIYFDYFTFREMGVFGMNLISNSFLSAEGDSVFTSRSATVFSKWDTDKSRQTDLNHIIKRIITCPVNLSFTTIIQDPPTKKYRVIVKNVQTHQNLYESQAFDELPSHFSYNQNGQKIAFSISPEYGKSNIYITDITSKATDQVIHVADEITNLQFVNFDSAIGYSTPSNWVQWNINEARIEKQISGTAFFSGFKLLDAISMNQYLLVHTQAMSSQGSPLLQSELQLSATGDFDVFANVEKGGEETVALQDGFNMQLNDLPDNFFDMNFNKSKTHFTILGNNKKRLQVWESSSRKKIMDKYFDNPVQGFIDESGKYVWVIEYKYGESERFRLRHIDLTTGKMLSSDQLIAHEGGFKNNSNYVSVVSVPGERDAWYVSDGDNLIWKFKGFTTDPEKYVFEMPGFINLRSISVNKDGIIYANIYNSKREYTLIAIDFNKKNYTQVMEGSLGSIMLYKDGVLLEGEQALQFYRNGKLEKTFPLEGKFIRMAHDAVKDRILAQVIKSNGEDGLYFIAADGSITYQQLKERMLGMQILPNGEIVYINESVKTFVDENAAPIIWNAMLSKDAGDRDVSVSANGRYIFKNHLVLDLKEANRTPADPFVQSVFVPGKSESDRIEIFSKGWNKDRYFTIRRISGTDTTESSQRIQVPDNADIDFAHNRLVISPDDKWIYSYANTGIDGHKKAPPVVWNVTTLRGYPLPAEFENSIPFFTFEPNSLFIRSDMQFEEKTMRELFSLNEYKLDSSSGLVAIRKLKKQTALNLPGEYNFELPEFTSIDWKLPNSTKNRKQFFSAQSLSCMAFDAKSQLLFGGTAEGLLHIWDIMGSSSPVSSLQVTNNHVDRIIVRGDRVYVFSISSNVAIYSLSEKKLLANLQYIQKDGEQRLAMYTPDKYFNLDPEAMDALHFTKKGEVFPLSSYELQGNRPDKVFKALGFADNAYLETLNKSWQTRLKRVGVKPSESFLQSKGPAVKWDKTVLPLTVKEKILPLNFLVTDSTQVPIAKLLIRINGVPLRSREGIQFTIPKDTLPFNERIVLNQGKNLISVIAINNKGEESVEQTHEVYYLPAQKQKSRIVYIGVGVSEYKDSLKNLVYAAKDVNDIAARIKHYADSVETYTLTNEKASKQQILKLKELLKKTNEDDVVILSFSGHGMIDSAAGFLFAPHDMNFNAPAQNGISMTMIEDLLDDIPARKRLLLMDACHSGEQLEGLSASAKLPEGVKEITTRGNETIKKKADKEKEAARKGYMAMKELFGDFSRGNGAFMISAAASNEFALESKQWSNGVFTASFLEALYELKQKTNDHSIKVRELRKAIYEKVKARTNGQQTPTSRQENGWWNWSF